MENNPLQRKVERRKHFSHDSEKPIGWYLKRVDKLITQNVNDMFAPMGLTRTHWQALNNTYHGRVKTRKDLHELIHDFVDLKTLDEVIAINSLLVRMLSTISGTGLLSPPLNSWFNLASSCAALSTASLVLISKSNRLQAQFSDRVG